MPRSLVSTILAIVCASLTAGHAWAAPYATDWIKGHNSRARLIVGGAPGLNGSIQRYLALEIAMQPGWKTYWRQPGPAGGIPPQITWQGSTNLKSATLKFPAPKRMIDPTGTTIGYKNMVVFPIAIEAEFPTRPIVVNVMTFFGVCREICIPAQATFKITLGPGNFLKTPPELAKALGRVPAKVNDIVKDKPILGAVNKTGPRNGKHALTFDVRFPGGTAGADLFAETGNQLLLAMSKVIARPSSDTIRYQIVVDDDDQWRELAKNGVVVTMVSDAAASEKRVARP